MSNEFVNLLDSAKYFSGKEHQIKAFNYLQKEFERMDGKVKKTFTDLYRNNVESQQSFFIKGFKHYSQRENFGDWDNDGRDERFQTCNVTSVAMVINFLCGYEPDIKKLDKTLRLKFGSRYAHSNLVKILDFYNVKSVFSMTTSHKKIKDHLKQNKPVIWSNRLTHGGHIVCITGFDDLNKQFQIYDPYGEPFPIAGSNKWAYKNTNTPYKLSYNAFNAVNANGYNTQPLHWCHLCSKK